MEYYPIYCKPVLEERIRSDDNQKLWRAIEPKLKQALHNIFFRVDKMFVCFLFSTELIIYLFNYYLSHD